MSMKAMVWAIENEQVFSSAHKFVLVALANFANDNGHTYPAVATICRITRQSDDTVRRCLKGLQDAGLIRDTGKRYGPTQQVKVWELPEETWKSKDPQGVGLQKAEDPWKTRGRPVEDPQGAGQTFKPLKQGTERKKTGLSPGARANPPKGSPVVFKANKRSGGANGVPAASDLLAHALAHAGFDPRGAARVAAALDFDAHDANSLLGQVQEDARPTAQRTFLFVRTNNKKRWLDEHGHPIRDRLYFLRRWLDAVPDYNVGELLDGWFVKVEDEVKEECLF